MIGTPDSSGSTVLTEKYTVDNANVDADLTDFPLLVRITSDSVLGAVCGATGTDVELLDSTGAALKFQRISFAVTGGAATAVYRTKAAIDSDADTLLYIASGAATDQQDAVNAYSGVTAHWLLGEASGTCYDSTANNHDLTAVNTPTYGQAAKVGNGVGTASGYFSTADHADFACGTNAITYAGWIYATAWSNWWESCFIAQDAGSGDNNKVIFGYETGTTKLVFHFRVAGGASLELKSDAITGGISTGAWHHVAVTRNGSTFAFYCDGAPVGTATDATAIPDVGAAVTLGWSVAEGGSPFNGYLNDWFFVNGTAWSAAWIKFLYENTNSADAEGAVSADTPDAVTITGNPYLGITGQTGLTVWAEVLNPLELRQVWNGTAYVAASTLADTAAWRACLVACGPQSLTDATATTVYVGGIPDALKNLPYTVVFYTGRFTKPGNIPYGRQVGQSLADLCKTDPSAALAYMR